MCPVTTKAQCCQANRGRKNTTPQPGSISVRSEVDMAPKHWSVRCTILPAHRAKSLFQMQAKVKIQHTFLIKTRTSKSRKTTRSCYTVSIQEYVGRGWSLCHNKETPIVQRSGGWSVVDHIYFPNCVHIAL